MRFQCLMIILVLTNSLVQSYNTADQPDLTEVELRLNKILKKFLTPHALQKLVEHIMNQITPRPPPPPEFECLCGRANYPAFSRIVKGETAEKNEFPWQVGLTRGYGRPDGDMLFCGGSIVSTRTIVTAAHCVKSVDDLWVVVAEHDITKPDGEKYYRVCDYVKHPNYHPSYSSDVLEKDDYNYAILTLCKELTWGHAVAPVCLPSTFNQGRYYENKKAIATGWGSTKRNPFDNEMDEKIPEKLQKVTLHTMRNEECCDRYTTTAQLDNCTITPRMICAAGIPLMYKGPCYGDDGGPLVVHNSDFGAYVLVGIASMMIPPCGAVDNPGVYARVTDQLHWLNENKKGTSCPIQPYIID